VGRILAGNLAVFALDRSGGDHGGNIWSIAPDSVFVAGNTNDGRLQVFATDEKGMAYSNWQQTPGGRWQSRWNAMGRRNGLAFGR